MSLRGSLDSPGNRQVTYQIICSFSPFGWHFSTCLYVVSILFWASELTETQAAGQGWVQPRAVGPGWHPRCVRHLEPWVPSWVISTDTAVMQGSDGNNAVTCELEHLLLYVRGSFHWFHWVSGQVLNAAPAFRLPQLSQWLSAHPQVTVASTPLGALPVPQPIPVLPWRLPRSAMHSIRWAQYAWTSVSQCWFLINDEFSRLLINPDNFAIPFLKEKIWVKVSGLSPAPAFPSAATSSCAVIVGWVRGFVLWL